MPRGQVKRILRRILLDIAGWRPQVTGIQWSWGHRSYWVLQPPSIHWASLVAQMVKHLSTMWETQVRSLGGEDPLEKEMATHSSTLAWKIPWTEEPGRLQSMGSQRVGHDWVTSLLLSLGKKIQEENICISAHMWYIHSWKKILTLKITRLIGNRRVRDRPFTTYSVTKKVYNQRNNKSNNWYLGRSFGCPGKHLGVVWACLMGC